LHDPCMPADHRKATDAAELVDGDTSRNEGLVFDGDVATEHRAVGKDHVVAQHHVVAKVAAGHDVVVIANLGGVLGLQANMNGHTFTEHVVVANLDRTGRSGAGCMLRCATNHGVLTKLVVTSGADSRPDHGARADNAVVAEADIPLDPGKCLNLHANAEASFGVHASQWMDAHGTAAFHGGLGEEGQELPTLCSFFLRINREEYRLVFSIDSMSILRITESSLNRHGA